MGETPGCSPVDVILPRLMMLFPGAFVSALIPTMIFAASWPTVGAMTNAGEAPIVLITAAVVESLLFSGPAFRIPPPILLPNAAAHPGDKIDVLVAAVTPVGAVVRIIPVLTKAR